MSFIQYLLVVFVKYGSEPIFGLNYGNFHFVIH